MVLPCESLACHYRLDVVAQKGNKMRGQAFVVFEEQSAATAAMRALVGEEFYGRPLVSATSCSWIGDFGG